MDLVSGAKEETSKVSEQVREPSEASTEALSVSNSVSAIVSTNFGSFVSAVPSFGPLSSSISISLSPPTKNYCAQPKLSTESGDESDLEDSKSSSPQVSASSATAPDPIAGDSTLTSSFDSVSASLFFSQF